MKQHLTVIFVFAGLLAATPAAAQDARDGADEYKLCAGCHGFEGQGNHKVAAPSLAGMEDWYLKRQLRHFRDGVRGAADTDQHGRVMAAMSYGLKDDEDIADIAAYVDQLPVRQLESTVGGDAARGKTLYMTCSACHGQNAEGNATLNAPALVTLDDWYQVRQLENFRNGIRGADTVDTFGMQMTPMAKALPDDQALKDVVAYISSLAKSD